MEVPGPLRDGIWLRAQVVNLPDRRRLGYAEGPYWRWSRASYLLVGTFLAADLRYGATASPR